ncbi:NINE protein [Kurthia gibsonii]|nr:NINE protein [Kurthia gibsonii]
MFKGGYIMTDTAPALKSKKVAWVLWLFLGLFFGAHRIYLNRMGSGLAIMSLGFFTFILSFLAVGLYVFIILGIVWIIEGIRLNKLVDLENAFILNGGYDQED